MSIDARLKVVYLFGIAVAAFTLHRPWAVGALLALQAALCLGAGVGLPRLLRSIRKLSTFFFFLALVMAFFPGSGRAAAPREIVLGPFHASIYVEGLADAAVWAMQLLTVVFASTAVRASGPPGELAAALGRMGLPRVVSLAMDVALEMVEGEGEDGRMAGGGGRGTGGGGGRGGGRGRHGNAPDADPVAPDAPEGRLARLRRYVGAIRRADATALSAPLSRSLERAERKLHRAHPDLPPEVARDAAVLAGVTAAMVGMKMLKTLPGLPFAPGHKNAVILPLYILAAELTATPFGATFAGLTMGLIAFLMGDGRYGVFEIAKHVAPGILVDLFYPLVRRLGRPRVWVYAIFGAFLALGRLGAEVAVALAWGAPVSFYAVIGTVGVTHVAAGALSGFITVLLLNSLSRLRHSEEATQPGSAPAHTTGDGN